MIRKVFDISDINLADVPARLRDLADEIEAMKYPVRACVVVIDVDRIGVDVRGYGRGADHVRALGLLHMGSFVMAASVVDAPMEDDHPTTPPAA